MGTALIKRIHQDLSLYLRHEQRKVLARDSAEHEAGKENSRKERQTQSSSTSWGMTFVFV
jgi:hypothetical protein